MVNRANMHQLTNYGDERQTFFCVYCGGDTRTRDHVPSKVFLDEPYPTNLPVVPACRSCNEGFSIDEEYVACLVECALTGSVKIDAVNREKIKKILQKKPSLISRLDQAREKNLFGDVSFKVDMARIKNVVLKLGRGHAAYELNEPQMDDPAIVSFVPLPLLTEEERNLFETPPWSSVWPEVGSRAMQRLVVVDPGASLWVIVQPGRYRYLTSIGDGVVVRVVISEYLGCEVVWVLG
jgi:hypothetical protein